MATKYIVVGAGVAGATACQAILDTDPYGEISLFSDEPYPFYSRMRLPEVISGKSDPQRLVLRTTAWFEQKGIDFHLGEPIQEMGLDPLRVVSQKGEYRADRLLLATGGYSFLPPIPGTHLAGVFSLRSMSDAISIRDAAGQASRAVVLGGGVLGLELGNALRLRGLGVMVVEVFERLLPRQTDPTAARILQDTMERMGFQFRLGAKAKEIQGDGDRARALLLENGDALEADVFVISAGVRPRLELARPAGLKLDKALMVDDRMQTSAPNVYAAGDCVQHRDVYYGIWAAAEEQGRVAGINMAGGRAVYKGTLMSNQLKVLGIDLLAAGQIDPEGNLEAEVSADPIKGVYRKLVYREDRIVGAILLGDLSGHRNILRALEEAKSASHLKGSLLDNPDALYG